MQRKDMSASDMCFKQMMAKAGGIRQKRRWRMHYLIMNAMLANSKKQIWSRYLRVPNSVSL